MSRFLLLDTGTAQDYVSDRAGVRERVAEKRRRGVRVGICTPVLAELWAGVELSQTRERNRREHRRVIDELPVWPLTDAAAEEYGRLFATLRRAGRAMQQIDILIAAIAISLGDCTVATKDTDLTAVPGLAVELWTVPPT